MLLAQPPPKVGHIRIGNLSMRAFHESLTARWPVILELSSANKLVVVHHDRIECVL
jgi:predicted nuclease of predicted toxin-antitoxin system